MVLQAAAYPLLPSYGIGQAERNQDYQSHGSREESHVLGLDGQDARYASHTDGIGLDSADNRQHRAHCRSGHCADKWKTVFQIHTKHGWFCYTQVTGNAGGYGYFLCLGVILLEKYHGQYSGALGDIGQGNHGPQGGASKISYQLKVNGIAHMMKSRDYKWRVEESKDTGKHSLKGGCQACVHTV